MAGKWGLWDRPRRAECGTGSEALGALQGAASDPQPPIFDRWGPLEGITNSIGEWREGRSCGPLAWCNAAEARFPLQETHESGPLI